MGQLHVPHLVDSKFLLYILNGLLSCTAVLLQPLWLSSSDSGKPTQSPAIAAAARSSRNAPAKTSSQGESEAPVKVALVGLPLHVEEGGGRPGMTICRGVALVSDSFPYCKKYFPAIRREFLLMQVCGMRAMRRHKFLCQLGFPRRCRIWVLTRLWGTCGWFHKTFATIVSITVGLLQMYMCRIS